MSRKFWISFLISLIVFSALFSLIGQYILKDDTAISKGEDYVDGIDGEENTDGTDDESEILFLFMGIDDLEGKGGVKAVKEMEEDENGYKNTGLRSDTMILCKFSYDTGQITMLSIPRDSRVYIRGESQMQKINHAHSIGGPNLAVKTVKDFLGVDLKYYVTVDYEAVKEIVDAIGGVEIDVPQRMDYKDPSAVPPLIIDIYPGQQVLNGDKSLEYLRFRSYTDGDLGRIKAQQLFLREFLDQILTAKNITKIPKMINTYFDYVDTNIPVTKVLKVVPKLNDISLDNIEIKTIPGEGKYIGDISYFIPNEEEMKELVEDMFENFILK